MTRGRRESMTEADRAFLARALTETPVPRAVPVVAFLFGILVYSALALLAAGLLARVAGLPFSPLAWRTDPLAFRGSAAVVGAVILALGLSSLRWLRTARRARAERRRALRADLDAGMVTVEDLDVTGIKLLREPEHGGLIHLLRLSNRKVLALYDIEAAGAPALVPAERLGLRSFSNSKRRRWAFSGAPLVLPEPIELAVGPEAWPEDEAWCRVRWEEVERHFGPKQGQAAASSRS